jgi:hypothetical protein
MYCLSIGGDKTNFLGRYTPVKKEPFFLSHIWDNSLKAGSGGKTTFLFFTQLPFHTRTSFRSRSLFLLPPLHPTTLLLPITTGTRTTVLTTILISTLLTGFRLLPQYWGRENGVLFLRWCISLKNLSYRPLLRESTSPFKSMCL